MKTCVIMQPTYLPWLGYFDLIRNADVFVILDHVQFSKQSWQQRNRVRDKRGEVMLTVPVKHSGLKETIIKDVEVDHARKPLVKHMRSIQNCYSKSINFDSIAAELELLYQQNCQRLMDLRRVASIRLPRNAASIR